MTTPDADDSDDVSLASVLAACGSSSHSDPLTPPALQTELEDIHPVVLAQLIRRWANARDEQGYSSAEHPQFRDTVNSVLDSYDYGYADSE